MYVRQYALDQNLVSTVHVGMLQGIPAFGVVRDSLPDGTMEEFYKQRGCYLRLAFVDSSLKLIWIIPDVV